MKKRNIVFPALAIMLSSLTGCGSGNGGGGDYDLDNFLPNGVEGNPYQIVKEPVTIKVFAPHSSGQPEYKDLKMFKVLSQKTNLNFEFTTPDSSAYNTQREAVLGKKSSWPDLFLFNNDISSLVTNQEYGDGIYTPFNDASYKDDTGAVGSLIDNYMPTYKALLEENFKLDKNQAGDAKQVLTLSDGKMYSTISAKDVNRDLTFKFFINQTWIKNVATSHPTDSYCGKNNIKLASDIKTIDDYLGVLRDFKKYDANNDGDSDNEIPVSSQALQYFRNFIISSYGHVTQGMELDRDGSKFTFVPTTDAYREYLKIANLMWSEGLMDRSTFENKSYADLSFNGSNGLLGSFEAAAPYLVTTQKQDTYNNERLDKEYYPVAPLTSAMNNIRMHWGFGYFNPDAATITTSSLYKREIARLLDIMYSELGQQLIAYGLEGEDWTWDDEAKTSWTFKVPESWTKDQESYRATITPNVGSGAACYWSNDFVGKMNDEVITKLNNDSSIYSEFLYVPVPGKYHFTCSEYEEISALVAKFDMKLPVDEANFVKGVKNPNNDADWNTFKTNVISYVTNPVNGHTLESIYNEMLTRYK